MGNLGEKTSIITLIIFINRFFFKQIFYKFYEIKHKSNYLAIIIKFFIDYQKYYLCQNDYIII